ncbi:MAG: metallophosphoesterase [Tannerellaceae bacterium]|jgi:predicted MPP superfamily phosphohydrolase|nr:metallophosphoesterase [Tannerellaceae bacterium]
MRVFLQSLIAQLLLNPYVFWHGRQALPVRGAWRPSFALLFLLELAVYTAGYIFHKTLPDDIMIAIMQVCGAWYVGLVYATIFLLLLDCVRLSNRVFPWYPAWVVRRWGELRRASFIICITGVVSILVYGYHRVATPVVRHLNISVPKGEGCAPDSLTVVLMTDLHIGEIIDGDMVRRYVELSNAQHPDIVLIGGDLVDYEVRFAQKARAQDDLRRLESKDGVYAIYGNHEYRANRHEKEKWIRSTGAALLIDSAVLIRGSFYIVGRDDAVNRRRAALHSIVKGLDRTKPLVVLDHQPVTPSELVMNGAALGLHGHTHNGQLWPYSLALRFVYQCPYGYYTKGGTQFYISSGIGAAGPPYRVGTVSELVVLHLRLE